MTCRPSATVAFTGATCATNGGGAHADPALSLQTKAFIWEEENSMSTATAPRLHHLALTVTDVDASVRWYEDVFGIQFRMDVPHAGGVGKLLADDDRQLMIVLHHHDTGTGTMFGETVTGLDHAGGCPHA